MYITTKGLILRETHYKDADKILTVLTESEGKLTVSARGVKRKGCRYASAVQHLCLSEMTLFGSRGRWSLNEAETVEQFAGLRADLRLYALGSYIAELLEAVSDEDSPDARILSLGLNSLYALSNSLCDAEIVKAAFELRLMCLTGYEPALASCEVCGGTSIAKPVLDLSGGAVYCKSCAEGAGLYDETEPACEGSLSAMRYITEAPGGKIFSFSLDNAGGERSRLGKLCESYVRVQLEREFKTLDYYKSLE